MENFLIISRNTLLNASSEVQMIDVKCEGIMKAFLCRDLSSIYNTGTQTKFIHTISIGKRTEISYFNFIAAQEYSGGIRIFMNVYKNKNDVKFRSRCIAEYLHATEKDITTYFFMKETGDIFRWKLGYASGIKIDPKKVNTRYEAIKELIKYGNEDIAK